MKTFRKILLIALAVILAILAASAAIAGNLLFQLNRKTRALQDDCSALVQKYPEPVQAGPEASITQQVSCGYAVIQLFGQWADVNITEEALARSHDSVATATADGFCQEMNRHFPDYHTEKQAWLTDSQLLETLYASLQAGIPVPIQWAAQLDGVWTLHYSLVTAMDLPGDRITVQNPYGYTEELTQAEFLSRTGFEAYDPMPLWLKMAFALDVFQKNTVFPVTPR